MNINLQLSMEELPSPIVETAQRNSRRSDRIQQRELQDSVSLSSQEGNDLLQSLQQKKQQNHSIIDKEATESIKLVREFPPADFKSELFDDNFGATESIKLTREFHPADFNSGLYADNAHRVNINQRTRINTTMISSKKTNPIDQPKIRQLEDSIDLEESQMKESKVSRKSLQRILDNKSRQWAEANNDIIFGDSQLDDIPSIPQLIKAPTNQRKNSIIVNYVDRNQTQRQNIPHQQPELMRPPSLSEAIRTSMMNTILPNIQNQQQQIPNSHLLHPQQMNVNQHGNLPSNFHPNMGQTYQNQNFNPMNRTQQYNHFGQQKQPGNPPTPRSETGWNYKPQENQPQNVFQPQQPQQNHSRYSNFEVMNEIRYLREDVRILREQWREERTEKMIEKKIEEKFKSESRRSRKASDSYDKQSILSIDLKTLMDEQESRQDQRMRRMQDLFMDKLSRLQKEQAQLKVQNSSPRRRSNLKHTESNEFSLGVPKPIPELLRNSSRRFLDKSTPNFGPSVSRTLDNDDYFLTSKLSMTRKQSPRKKQSPKKRSVSKRKNPVVENNNNLKKDNLKKDKFKLF